MRAVRLVAPVAAFLALAVGCGGGAGQDGLGSGAEIAPASTAAFVAVNTEFDGEQWQAAEALVDKFPGGRDALRDLLEDLEDEEIDFERDVKPAVGPEVDFVMLAFARGGDDAEQVVALTQPRDEDAFDALMKKGDDPPVYEMVDDWAVIADRQEDIDAFKAARGDDSLAESDAFKDAMDGLSDDALARVYVNGERLTEAARSGQDLSEDERAVIDALLPGGQIPSFGFAVRAEEEGVRFEGAYRAKGASEPGRYEAELPSELPTGPLFYVSFKNAAEAARDAIRRAGDANEDVDRYIAAAELALGVSIEEDVLPLFEGEGALVVYRSPDSPLAKTGKARIPTISLVLRVEDEKRALATANKIAARASAFDEGLRVRDVEIGGVPAKEVSLGDFQPKLYAAFDGKLVVTSTEDGIASLREEGPRLADDEEFEQAREAADAPDETVGFAYANVEDALTYFFELAQGEGGEIPDDVRENLEPLRSVFVYGTADDDEVSFEGLIGID